LFGVVVLDRERDSRPRSVLHESGTDPIRQLDYPTDLLVSLGDRLHPHAAGFDHLFT